MKKIILSFFLIACSSSAIADWSIDIGAGYSAYQPGHNGLWYQEQHPHTLDMKSPSLSLGVSYGRGDYRYRVEFVSLGWVYADAAVVADHDNYPGSTAKPFMAISGRGHSDGIVISASKTIVGGLYAEAGIWVFKPMWKVHFNTIDRENPYSAELTTPPEWHVGPAVGIGYRYKAIDLSLRYLDMQDHGKPESQPIYNGAYVFLVKVCL